MAPKILELTVITTVTTRVCLLEKVDGGSWVEYDYNIPLLMKLPTCFPCLSVFVSYHINLHLHKSSTLTALLAFSITAEQRSAVSCGLHAKTNHICK